MKNNMGNIKRRRMKNNTQHSSYLEIICRCVQPITDLITAEVWLFLINDTNQLEKCNLRISTELYRELIHDQILSHIHLFLDPLEVLVEQIQLVDRKGDHDTVIFVWEYCMLHLNKNKKTSYDALFKLQCYLYLIPRKGRFR